MSAEFSGQTRRSTSSPKSGIVPSTCSRRVSPGARCANRPAFESPWTAATRNEPEDTNGQAGTASTATMAAVATTPRSVPAILVSSTHCSSNALSVAMTKLRPEAPIQATSGANGLSDWEKARRPQEKPPYGQTAAIASRSVQRPPRTTGSIPSRPPTPGHIFGTNRQARAMSTAPSAKKIDCSPASASHGIGPR